MHSTASRFATLMGTASIFALGNAMAVQAQQQTAQAQMAQAAPETIPEQVLITGSLIHGTAAVGVPVTNLGAQDLTQTGATTLGELFRTVPEANTAPGVSAINSGGQQEREIRVNIRGLDQTGPRTLLMVDGVKFPPQADGLCSIDPSIIPALALDRVDILADGASATYGSDAIAGVINVILKRGFDGAVTLLHFDAPTDGGGQEYQASQLYGRTWDGGDITLTYEYTHQQPVKGTVHSNYTLNYTPWGLDNEIPIGSSLPGTITTGAPAGMLGANIGTICSNCWAIPKGTGANFNAALNGGTGPTTPGSAATLNWATLTANAANFKTNEVDPLKYGWEISEQDKNAFVATFDQRLFPGVSFYAEGFYDNRRVVELDPPIYSQGVSNDVKTWPVPTINPYYPTGAPNGLRVSYDFGPEVPPREPAFEISYRYHAGFNLDLPFNWIGNLYYAHSFEQNFYQLNEVNPNAISIALGNTVQGVTKPAALPYLNLFCDPLAFQCNSPQTLQYISAQRVLGDIYQISETGGRFDGPLFDLPGGQVKAAIGGLYESDNVVGTPVGNSASEVPTAGSTTPAPLIPISDSEPYNVWAEFAQLDIPIFGDNFNLPLVRKLDLEGSVRHDSYSGTLNGGTTNPKVAFTWLIDEMVGATVRGSWGTSFRFANAGEYSTVLSDPAGGLGLPGDTAQAQVTCTNNMPTPGSTAAVLFAAGFTCQSAPGGLTWGGGPHAAIRDYVNAQGQAATREGGLNLAPETSKNYSIGIEIAPQYALLRGLDLQATFYSVKVNNTLLGFTANNTQTLNDPTQRFRYIVPSDLGCPVSANAAPTTCAPFEAMVLAQLHDRNTTEPLSNQTDVYWIADGSTVNTGYLHPDGIDYNASYDIDLGDYGAWNTGITGTYYLHYWQQLVAGTAPIDALHDNIPAIGGVAMNGVAAIPSGVPAAPRMSYRARLGWSDGPYSVTGFLNYSAHFFAPWGSPPNVNFQCTTAGGNIGGGTFPCAITNYTNIEPSFYTFDLSLGYNTGDMPASDYLKRINLQLTVQNITGRHSPFEYGPTTASRNIAAYDILRSNEGRIIGISVVKTW